MDFWQSDKQDRIQQYREVLEDAADFHLMVELPRLHASARLVAQLPAPGEHGGGDGGGAIQVQRAVPGKAPWHNTVLPFTRNVVGGDGLHAGDFHRPQVSALTTNAHELALSVVFEIGVQHLADSDKSLSRS